VDYLFVFIFRALIVFWAPKVVPRKGTEGETKSSQNTIGQAGCGEFEGFAPADGPLSAGNCWLVAYWDGSLLFAKLVFAPFWYTEWPFWWPRGSTGTPNGHLEARMSIFINFRIHSGSLLWPMLEQCSWFACDLDGEAGRLFAAPSSEDLAREMMPEPSGCMCYDQSKNSCFCMASLFRLFTNSSPLGAHLELTNG